MVVIALGRSRLVRFANLQADVELHLHRAAGLLPDGGAWAVAPRGCATRESFATFVAAEGSRCTSFRPARTSKSP